MTTGWPWLERGTVNGPRDLKNSPLWSSRFTLAGSAKRPRLLVHDQRAVFPGVPMAEHHFHEFVRPVVAEIVREMGVLAHIVRLAVVQRGDDVPGRPPARHQVEGRKTPRDIERFEIGGRSGRAEPELFGGHAHAGQHHDRIHLHAADAVFDGMGVIVAVAVRHRQPVVEKRHMEFAGFQDPADLLVVVRRHRIVARLRMAPRARQIGAVLRLQEADHHHLPCHAALRVPVGRDVMPDRARRRACSRPPARAIFPRWRPRFRCRRPCAAARGYIRPRPDRTRRWSLPTAASP